MINKIFDNESPGLVVLNGDLITGENAFLENSTAYVDMIVGPLLKRGLTWASTYGNHDSDYNISRANILAREQRWPNARTTKMVSDANAGISNYYLPVYSSQCQGSNCQPSLLLWFFDSRGGKRFQQKDNHGNRIPVPSWVDVSVVNWFKKTNAQLVAQNGGKTIPSLAFVHIPTYASLAAQLTAGAIGPRKQPGINDDLPLSQQAQGWCSNGSNGGSCKYGGQDIPFMNAIVTTPGMIAMFSGHDHGDTWCYKWNGKLPGMTVTGNGVNLCFGQHTGYGGYGNWIRGSRQVLVMEDDLKNHQWEADTWIRLESGKVVGRVSLNSTYGNDLYQATPNDKTYCPTCIYSRVDAKEMED